MKRKDYDALIEKLKTYAIKDPKGYLNKVVLLGFLGYAYIFFILLLVLGLIAGSIWLMASAGGGRAALAKILIGLGVLAFLIIKSLWIKMPPPDGVQVTKKSAPELFKVIEEIVAKQNSIVPDVVLINNDFNAFISQVPRLGIFGWYKNYLVLGLPYMLASTDLQFKAVLAHEFGHFSGEHGKTGVWIYRVRSSWYNILENMENNSNAGDFIFNWFFDWYVPYFNAYSFVLAREHEYEADNHGTDYVGAQANAEELINASIKGTSTGDYWNEVWERVNNDPLPPKSVFTDTLDLLKRTVPHEEYKEDLSKALKMRTQNNDTHPSLTDRLKSMGYEYTGDQIVNQQGEALVLQRDLTMSSAEVLLGIEHSRKILTQLDQEWFDEMKEGWEIRHKDVEKMKEQIRQYEKKNATNSLSQEDHVNWAYLIDQTGTRKQAIESIENLLATHPNHGPGHYRLGEILLEKNDDRGIEHLKKSMELSPSFKSSVLEKLSWYHESRGEYDDVEEVQDNLDEQQELDQKAYIERNLVTKSDEFMEHGLSDEIVKASLKTMEPFQKKLKKVYLIQKKLNIYPEDKLYVFVIKGGMSGFSDYNEKLLQQCIDTVELNCAEGTCYFLVGDAAVTKKAKSIPNSLIYKKGKEDIL